MFVLTELESILCLAREESRLSVLYLFLRRSATSAEPTKFNTMAKDSQNSTTRKGALVERIQKKLEKRAAKKAEKRQTKGGESQSTRSLNSILIDQQPWKSNVAKAKNGRSPVKLGKPKLLQKVDTKNLKYLRALLDPWNNPECKIPDAFCLPTSTFSIREKRTYTCLASTGWGAAGAYGYQVILAPWYYGTEIKPGGTLANLVAGTNVTSSQAANALQIMSNYELARPVSGGVKVRNISNANTTQGVLSVGMLMPGDFWPQGYNIGSNVDICDFMYVEEYALADGADALWLPVVSPSANPFIPTMCGAFSGLTNELALGTGYATYIEPGYLPAWGMVCCTSLAGATPSLQTMQGPSIVMSNQGGNYQKVMDSPYPLLLIAVDGAVSGQQFEIEYVWNFEGIPRKGTFGLVDPTPSPVNPTAMAVAAQVVANKEIVMTKRDLEPSFVDQILGGINKAGSIVENAVGVAAKIAPVIKGVAGMLL